MNDDQKSVSRVEFVRVEFVRSFDEGKARLEIEK